MGVGKCRDDVASNEGITGGKKGTVKLDATGSLTRYCRTEVPN